jgi:hypothetical protein
MAQHDAVDIVSKEAIVDEFYTLLTADSVLLKPDRGIPVTWDTQSKVHLLVEVQTQRVSKDDNPGRRCEIVHSKVLTLVADQTPHASMVLGFALTEGPTTFQFAESGDRVFSDAIYQCVIN